MLHLGKFLGGNVWVDEVLYQTFQYLAYINPKQLSIPTNPKLFVQINVYNSNLVIDNKLLVKSSMEP